MKLLVLMAAYVAVSTSVALAQACPPKTPTETWMEGNIGDSRIRVYLHSHPDSTVEGSFYDLKTWAPVTLEGTLAPNCELRLKESHGPNPDGTMPEGTWTATLRDGRTMTGRRASSPAQYSGPIILQRVAKIDCDGKGRWIRFQKKGFPVSFEYPEDWHVTESDNSIIVECPDPRTLAFSPNGIEFDSIDEVKTLTQYGGFTKYQGTWFFNGTGGECDPPDASCVKADLASQTGITILHGSGLVRLYGPTRYVGQGDEEAYLILLPDRSVAASSTFVGLDVANRVVSSVRVQR